ncbi:YraN family protein [Ruminiclostridium josui]|uniref:YraN family protein n=1 Tax=Ruminiclostridium josui TaxID=1499 RepID=UPI000467A541|nr:YraN family protein [Ruminiclostridium josui]
MTDSNKREIGAAGEKEAVEFLQRNGYTILKANYRVGRLGEIDIIANENEYICFIEVKTRRTITFGTPGEAVNWVKQQKIRQIASIYLTNTRKMNTKVRFDVVEVLIEKSTGNANIVKSINLIKDAF